MYKVLITTSGTGSRLGILTKNLNKALIPIAGKPAISYIINQFPKDTEFVLTAGYLREQIKTEIPRLFPDRKITFIDVDKFEGPGSSLAYSMLKAEKSLQEPFIFCSCDTIVKGRSIPDPSKNWIGGFQMEGDLSQYRTIQADVNNKIIKINEKGEGNSKEVLIGVFGINDFKSYWENLNQIYNSDPLNQTLNDTSPFNEMIKQGTDIKLINFPVWLDTGNPKALEKTRKKLESV